MDNRITLPALALLSTLSYTAPAAASNFSYSYLEASLEGLAFDENLRAGNVYFEGINGAAVAGSFQFTDRYMSRWKAAILTTAALELRSARVLVRFRWARHLG